MMGDGIVYLPPKPYAATVAAMRDGSTGFGEWPADEGVPENIPPGAVAADERFADEQELPAREIRSLDTPCACGHTRRDHTGMRMEVDGRCRECDCDKFTEVNAAQADDELLQRMRAMVARVERMQRLAIGLRAGWSPAGKGRGSNPPR